MNAPLFRAKYVVLLNEGLEVPVILPENSGMQHKEACQGKHVIAAGFCELHTLGDGALGFTAGGESLGLKLKARPEKDAHLLDFHYLKGGFGPCSR